MTTSAVNRSRESISEIEAMILFDIATLVLLRLFSVLGRPQNGPGVKKKWSEEFVTIESDGRKGVEATPAFSALKSERARGEEGEGRGVGVGGEHARRERARDFCQRRRGGECARKRTIHRVRCFLMRHRALLFSGEMGASSTTVRRILIFDGFAFDAKYQMRFPPPAKLLTQFRAFCRY